MDIDAIKAPRTHAAWEEAMKDAVDSAEPLRFMLNHSCKLEYELNAVIANEAIAENKVHILEKELEKANNRIKRLEEGGDEAICALEYASRVRIWTEAKEAKL